MAKWQLNRLIYSKQRKTLTVVVLVFVFILVSVELLLADASPKRKRTEAKPDLTGLVEESFSEAVADNVLMQQQADLEDLKKQVSLLATHIKKIHSNYKKQLQREQKALKQEISQLIELKLTQEKPKTETPPELKTQEFWHQPKGMNPINPRNTIPQIHAISFRHKSPLRRQPKTLLNSAHYVPSNTSVRAVILGGADADASVNGQSKNNGVMLFKFLDNGTLPNGQHSRLSGCRVSASTYGDISSERAFATLYRLSCARYGEPIIDKEVTGWVFFNGKVGIKGQPLMRDSKVMTWAGVSGALSGIAQAAQYAQSIQNIGPYGATSVVPSAQIAPFAAYGGASKAADTLSQYYVKRAEQYHPVIQVGAGNVVTVVFKDGFYLEPDEKDDQQRPSRHLKPKQENQDPLFANPDEASSEMNFTVPPEVLSRIDSTNAYNQSQQGVLP